jgi:hypothetical protein
MKQVRLPTGVFVFGEVRYLPRLPFGTALDIVVLFVRLRGVVYIENMSVSSDEEELLLLYALTESQQKMKRIFHY